MVRTLQTAMRLLSESDKKADRAPPGSAGRSQGATEFTRSDRLSLYLELSDCYRMDGQNQEAARVMQEAMSKYQGTAEEIRLTVANADLALEKGDVETALNILKTIGPEQPYYLQARYT